MSENRIWHAIDPQVGSLKDIIEKVETEKERLNYYKYIHIFKLVKQFVIDNHLILYGGTAINELLPRSQKIYGPYDMTDLDIMSPNSKEDAIRLGKYLKQHKVSYIEIRNGLHKGTYKVSAEFITIADITKVNKNLYTYLLQESEKNPKATYSDPLLHIAPINFIKWSFHNELASPESSIHRWEKIFDRYLIFEKLYPVQKVTYQLPTAYKDEVAMDVLRQLNDIIKTMQYPLTGAFAINLHQSGRKVEFIADDYLSSFEILSDNLEKHRDYISSLLNIPSTYKLKYVYRSSHPSHADKYFIDILPPRIRIFLVNKETQEHFPVLTLVKVTHHCYAIVKKHGYSIGSLDTILQMLYAYYMTYQFFMRDEEKDINSKKILSQIQKCNQSMHAHEVKSRFSSLCYGKHQSLIDILKELWDERPFRYRPGEQKTPRTKSNKTKCKKTKSNKNKTKEIKTKNKK